MQKGKQIYSGKAKNLYATENPDFLILHFRDDATAFDGTKKATLANKGNVNNAINAFIMQKLAGQGIPTHYVETLSANESLVKHLEMIPVECVLRNFAAGGLSKRLGIPEGTALQPPVFEFFLKNDELHDPMINRSHIKTFGWASDDELKQMETLSMRVNEILTPLFAAAGMMLVDYKLEFGRFHGKIVLGDEFTPDGCRIWDSQTHEKMDKDRFRRDLGDVIEHYQTVATRLNIPVD